MPRIIIKRPRLRPKDLIPILPPLRMIHPINPPLMLDHHTPILLHILPELIPLARLQWNRPRLGITRIHLQRLLVCEDIHLDARVGGT